MEQSKRAVQLYLGGWAYDKLSENLVLERRRIVICILNIKLTLDFVHIWYNYNARGSNRKNFCKCLY
jgi:hypothetical protein